LSRVVGIDSSEHLNFVGFISGTMDDLIKVYRMVRGGRRIHMSELKPRERRMCSGQPLAILRDRRFDLKAICAYSGISDLRYELSKSTRVPSSRLEDSLKRNLAKVIWKIALTENLGKAYADVEISQLLGKLGIRSSHGLPIELADIIAWTNLRRPDDITPGSRFSGAIKEFNLKEELAKLVKSELKI